MAGIVAQTRQDVGTEPVERIADVLRQRLEQSGIDLPDDEIEELAHQVVDRRLEESQRIRDPAAGERPPGNEAGRDRRGAAQGVTATCVRRPRRPRGSATSSRTPIGRGHETARRAAAQVGGCGEFFAAVPDRSEDRVLTRSRFRVEAELRFSGENCREHGSSVCSDRPNVRGASDIAACAGLAGITSMRAGFSRREGTPGSVARRARHPGSSSRGRDPGSRRDARGAAPPTIARHHSRETTTSSSPRSTSVGASTRESTASGLWASIARNLPRRCGPALTYSRAPIAITFGLSTAMSWSSRAICLRAVRAAGSTVGPMSTSRETGSGCRAAISSAT